MPVEPLTPIDLTIRTAPATIATRQEFADALTALRLRAGRTVRELARMTGIPASTVGGYLSGRHLPPVSQPDHLPNVVRACGVTDDRTVAQWRQALERVRLLPGPRPEGAPAPYRGLASFQPGDAEWFFGRRELTRAVLTRLAEPDSARPVAVVGPSGSGKSSLLRAGVIPAIRDGALGPDTGEGEPVVLLFTPGAHPLAALSGQLATITGASAEGIAGDLRADPGRCTELAAPAAGSGGLVIVVDQLEEVFTECRDDDERQVFLAAVLAAARSAAAVLLGLRADFYHRALSEPLLVPALQRSQVAVGPMTEPELREAIIAPARKAHLDVEGGLVEVLLRDLAPPANGNGADGAHGAHEAGALPLLSHALRATWERCTRGRLTVADYQATGGIRGGVAGTADAVFDRLSGAEQALARRLLVRLVRLGEDVPNTRRRVSRGELEQLVRDSGVDRLGDVLDRFVDQRLITVDAETVEITHEALVVAWPRLRDWVGADRRALLVGQQLDDIARQWQREQRDPAILYRGARLSAAREWADNSGNRELTVSGREFLQASVHREQRRVRMLQQTIAALAVLLLLAATGGVFALQQRGEAVRQRAAADHERNAALSRMVAVRADRLRDTDPALAMQLSVAAYRIAPTVEARSSLLSSSAIPAVTRLLGADGVMQDVAISPDHALLAGASDDAGLVLLWDIADPHRPALLVNGLPGLAGVANAVAFHPDGRLLAAGGADQAVYLYDLADPTAPADLGVRMAEPDDTIMTLAFSPDGTRLAAGGLDAAVHLWDVTNPGAPAPLGDPLTAPADSVAAVAFSPDGRVLVAGGHDGSVHRWDVTDPAGPASLGDPLTGPDRIVYSVSFGPDSELVAAAGTDQNIYLWNVTDPSVAPATVLTGPSGTGWVHSLAVSPDGETVAAGTGDGMLRLWDRDRGEVTTVLPHPGPVTGLVFEAGGQALYAGAADGLVRRWTLPGPVLRAATGTIFDVVHHPAAAIVAAASNDGRVYLWDIADPQHPVLLGDPLASPDADSGLVGTVAVSPDGRELASSGRDGTTWRWDLTDPSRPAMIAPSLPELPTFAESLAYRPDGTLLAAGDADGTVQLWDLTDPADPVAAATMTEGWGNVYSVAFHPDGQLLAVGAVDRVVWLWDVSDPGRPILLGEPLSGPANYVYSVAFSPDGDTLVLGSADETVRLWDVSEPSRPEPGPVLTGPRGYVTWVAFSPDGDRLAAGSHDHTVWLWDVTDLADPEPYGILAAPEGIVNMIAFSPDSQTIAAGSNDTTVRLWQTDPERVAAHVCAVAGDPVTPQEWQQHVPGLPYQPPCRATDQPPGTSG